MSNNHSVHNHSVRVYYEDTDSGGVVYYANYLKFAERARTEWLRAFGINQFSLAQDNKIAFVVRRCLVEYFRSAKLDDLLTITSKLVDISKASLTMNQTISCNDDIIAALEIKLAVINSESGKIGKMPEALFIKLKEKISKKNK